MPYTYLFDLFNNSDDSLVTGWTGVSVTGLMLNVTGLPQATEYYYKIKQKYTSIYGTEIISAYSDRRDVTTLNFNDTITNLSGTIDSINYESFVFNFNRYPLPTYRITVAQDGLPLSNYTSILVTGTTLSVTGLTNALSYDVSVNILYNALEEVETYTQTIPTILPPSSVATSGSPLATEFTASWTNASGITQNLFYLSDDNFATYIINGDIITGDNFSVTGLTESTSYKYALRSYLNGLYGIQQSGLSDIVEVTTASAGSEPAIPTGVAVSGVTNTSGMVYWSSVDTATGYSGEYSANDFVTGTTFTTTDTSYSITGLAENTLYEVRVKAVNEFGESAFSSEISFTKLSELILYSSNKSGGTYIYKTNFAKSPDSRLATQTTNGESRFPSDGKISPNGRYIAYNEFISGRDAIMIWDRQNNTSTNITNNTSFTYLYPCWQSNNNDEIFYVNDNGSTYAQIEKVNINTLTKTTLKVGTITTVIRNIAFNPSGTKLFLNLETFFNTDWRVGWIDASDLTGAINTFVTFGNDNIVYELFWKPDEAKLAISSRVSGVAQIFEVNSDGTGLTQRTASDGKARRCPVYSPDGTKILFRETSGSDSYIVSADTTYDGFGYFENQTQWINNSGNLTESPLDWKNV